MINDINGDDMIDVADMNAVINFILFESSETELKACDENDDGTVDVADMNRVINYILQE